jgi:hypothetical protein
MVEPTLTQLADEYARTAEKAEQLARRAQTDAARSGLEIIALTWREMEAGVRPQPN